MSRVDTILTTYESQMLKLMLDRLSDEMSYAGCNDPEYPKSWKKEDKQYFDKLVWDYIVSQEPERAEDFPDGEEVFVNDSDQLQFLAHRLGIKLS